MINMDSKTDTNPGKEKNMTSYLITFKPTPRSNSRTWTRFYSSDETARTDAAKVVEFETCGRGRVLSVDAVCLTTGC